MTALSKSFQYMVCQIVYDFLFNFLKYFICKQSGQTLSCAVLALKLRCSGP